MTEVERSEEDRLADVDAAGLIADIWAAVRPSLHDFERHRVLARVLAAFESHGIADRSRVALEQAAAAAGWSELEWALEHASDPDEDALLCRESCRPKALVGDGLDAFRMFAHPESMTGAEQSPFLEPPGEIDR